MRAAIVIVNAAPEATTIPNVFTGRLFDLMVTWLSSFLGSVTCLSCFILLKKRN